MKKLLLIPFLLFSALLFQSCGDDDLGASGPITVLVDGKNYEFLEDFTVASFSDSTINIQAISEAGAQLTIRVTGADTLPSQYDFNSGDVEVILSILDPETGTSDIYEATCGANSGSFRVTGYGGQFLSAEFSGALCGDGRVSVRGNISTLLSDGFFPGFPTLGGGGGDGGEISFTFRNTEYNFSGSEISMQNLIGARLYSAVRGNAEFSMVLIIDGSPQNAEGDYTLTDASQGSMNLLITLNNDDSNFYSSINCTPE